MDKLMLVAPDGARLSGRFFPAAAPRAGVVLASALGVRQSFYARFARHLAANGLSVLTFDYRGVGESAGDDLTAEPATLRTWGEDDVAAALTAAEARADGLPILMVGHSFGGQALGLAPVHGRVAGALVIGAQLGWTGHFNFPSRLGMELLFRVVAPAATRAWGYAPGWLGLGMDLPAGVIDEWGTWLLSRNYLLDHVPEADRAFAEIAFPVEVIAIADDGYAPVRAVEALAAVMPTATCRVWEPGAFGLKEIGHFGFFRGACRSMWDGVAADLQRLAGEAARPSQVPRAVA